MNVAIEDERETVSEGDVDTAVERVERGRIKDSIKDLTTHGQYVLLAVTQTAIEGETPVRAKELYEVYEDVAAEYASEPLSQRSVHDHLNDLSMLGFLRQHDRNYGRGGGQFFEYELDVDAAMVQEAIADADDPVA